MTGYYAIMAKHAKLRLVRRRLRRKGVNAYLPAVVLRRPVARHGRLKYRRHVVPLMSYILVEAPDHPATRDLWLHDVLSTKDVYDYVKIGDAHAIPQSAVDELKSSVARIVAEGAAARHKYRLRVGGKGTIKTGTLAGKTGSIQWITGKRAGLEARIFGSMRVLDVAMSNLESAA